jgi:hypothetical protein
MKKVLEILKTCPIGTELYTPLCGKVKLNNIFDDSIEVKNESNDSIIFNEDGSVRGFFNGYAKSGECLLFPDKYNYDWKAFSKISNIEEVLDYLNGKYTQQTICEGAVKIPEIEEYNDAVISFWACGAFVAINHTVYTVAENDMHWYIKDYCEKGINAAFIPSIIRALTRLKNHLDKDPRI